MVVGGGFIRDGVLGGKIGDIDVWLPSQTTLEVRDVMSASQFVGSDLIFELLPHGERVISEGRPEDYRDLSNLFVVETTCNRIKINLIKSMTHWETPSQFFESMFRNFDTEISMFFMGFIPTGGEHREIDDYSEFDRNATSTLILPYSYRGIHEEQDIQQHIVINPERVNVTSPARMLTRYSKLMSRYQLTQDRDAYKMNKNTDFYPIRISLANFDETLLHLMPLPILEQETTSWPNNTVDSFDQGISRLQGPGMTPTLSGAWLPDHLNNAFTTQSVSHTFGNTLMNQTSNTD